MGAFYPAQRFRKLLYNPELIQKVLEAGSVKAALQKLVVKTRAASVEEMLPPRVDVRIEQDAVDKAKVTLHVTAESTAAEQPVEMLRLLVDGRPLPDNQGVERLAAAQKKATARWTIPKLPGGKLELKVLARCPDVSGVSASPAVVVPAAEKDRPALHVVAVGVNYANSPSLKLDCPQNDAEAVAEAFRDACTGRTTSSVRTAPRQPAGEGRDRRGRARRSGKVRKEVKPQRPGRLLLRRPRRPATASSSTC